MYNTEIFIEHNGKPHFHYATTRVLTDAEIEKVKKPVLSVFAKNVVR